MWRAAALFVVIAFTTHSSIDAWDDAICQDSQGQVQSPSFIQRNAIATQEKFITASNSNSRARKTGQQQQELPKWKKLAFVCASVLYLVMSGFIMKMMIDNYEGNATPTTPPWYVDTHTVLKVSSYILISWLALGLVAFNQVLLFNDPPHHLTFAESMYLCSQIVTTVGYGDFTPSNPEGELFVACYVMVGVTLVAIAVTTLMNLLTSSPSDVSDDGNDEGTTSPRDHAGGLHMHAAASSHGAVGKSSSETLETHYVVARSVAVFLVPVIVGTLFFRFCPGEEKQLWDAFYMSCITLTTVGFGAFHPITQVGYIFATFWMLIGVACTANMICTITQRLTKHRRELTSALMETELLKQMDSDGSGKVDKAEFLIFELLRKGVVEKPDIDKILKEFSRLDADGSGYLDVDDLKSYAEKSSRRGQAYPPT